MLLYLANSHDSFRLDDILNKKSFSEVLLLDKGEPIVSVGAWSLMTNHFHLLIRQEIDGGITKFMKKLGTGYSMYFNIKYERTGALFGGLFKSKLIGVDDNYMRHLFGYIHINPLEIQFSDWEDKIDKPSVDMKKFLKLYRYSSYLDYIGENRVEKNVINPKNFPDYFTDTQSFGDFVESYFVDVP